MHAFNPFSGKARGFDFKVSLLNYKTQSQNEQTNKFNKNLIKNLQQKATKTQERSIGKYL